MHTTTPLKRPSHLLVEAMRHVRDFGHALDLGAGDFHDSIYLQSQGFHVTAVDKNPSEAPEGIEYVQTSVKDFEFGQYDLVTAQYTLPFLEPGIFGHIATSLREGGVFVGNVFALDNEFPEHARKYSKEQLVSLLSELRVVFVADVEDEHEDMSGHMRHWHTYEFIAIKQ